MLLGVPLDYMNDFDISNAIGTFGKFHDWHRDDPLLARTLVHASFPSPQLVPRDIVFGDYALFGGVRRGWTACCLILSANFADIIVTTQDFINFWGKFFAFVLLEMIEISQGFKTFESN
jgi:hypothetical protein